MFSKKTYIIFILYHVTTIVDKIEIALACIESRRKVSMFQFGCVGEFPSICELTKVFLERV